MQSRFVSEIANSTIEIIDCLSPDRDMQTGISIFNYLRDLTPENVPRIRRHSIGSEEEFWKCLDLIESQCIEGWNPIIHVEAHADKAGLEIRGRSDAPGSIFPWSALIDRFRCINIASKFNLGVFVAACEGVEALRPMTIKKAAPYMFLVGPNVQVSAEVVKTAAEGFYNVIINAPNLNRAFGCLPRVFTTFLAERFFATTYARVLKAQSFGRKRKERVDSLVNMVVPINAPPEQLKTVREMARLFSRPDRARFEAVQQTYLPAGVSFTFDDLVEIARTGKMPD
jgi:hypothetical protein